MPRQHLYQRPVRRREIYGGSGGFPKVDQSGPGERGGGYEEGVRYLRQDLWVSYSSLRVDARFVYVRRRGGDGSAVISVASV